MAVRKRNPILGGLMAAAFIGFGSYLLYTHFVLEETVGTAQLILRFGVVAYGLYIAYTLLPKKDV
ncbi:hypothetical protein [Nonlabens sp. Asnod3-A02]|uniref:hypothetical protein n=1 Tax=Nonlabens sp. Asnod3-A02 TaxID=3160579 RepID=UPI00386E7160